MTQTEQYQKLWKLYECEHDHIPASTRVVVEWAIHNGLISPPFVDPVDVLAGQMSRALREEYQTDEKGRRYRINHAVRYKKDGAQTTMWGILGFADQSYMAKAFTQRREQVVGDCHQLKTDVDVYNDKNPLQDPFTLVLDFTDDVAEREVWQDTIVD